jgi:8-oxo-dGTP pyrophosphatase MutT (NUDIX family)
MHGLKAARGAQDRPMREPGLDRHEWESELQALEPELQDSPAETLPELDALVRRMLEETGYDIDDPVVREGEEREVVAEYLAAHELAESVERDDDSTSPGDVAAAINGFRAVFDHLVAARSDVDAGITPSGEVEE